MMGAPPTMMGAVPPPTAASAAAGVQPPPPPMGHAFRPSPPQQPPQPGAPAATTTAPAPTQRPASRSGGGSGSRIDPSQIPRPKTSPLDAKPEVYTTRVAPAAAGTQTPYGTVANVPPPSARSSFVVQDTGNCSPRFLRSSLYQVPCTSELLATSSLP